MGAFVNFLGFFISKLFLLFSFLSFSSLRHFPFPRLSPLCVAFPLCNPMSRSCTRTSNPYSAPPQCFADRSIGHDAAHLAGSCAAIQTPICPGNSSSPKIPPNTTRPYLTCAKSTSTRNQWHFEFPSFAPSFEATTSPNTPKSA